MNMIKSYSQEYLEEVLKCYKEIYRRYIKLIEVDFLTLDYAIMEHDEAIKAVARDGKEFNPELDTDDKRDAIICILMKDQEVLREIQDKLRTRKELMI